MNRVPFSESCDNPRPHIHLTLNNVVVKRKPIQMYRKIAIFNIVFFNYLYKDTLLLSSYNFTVLFMRKSTRFYQQFSPVCALGILRACVADHRGISIEKFYLFFLTNVSKLLKCELFSL